MSDPGVSTAEKAQNTGSATTTTSAAAAAATSPPRPVHHKSTNQKKQQQLIAPQQQERHWNTTAQTMMLGRDADDHVTTTETSINSSSLLEKNDESPSSAAAGTSSSSWWERGLAPFRKGTSSHENNVTAAAAGQISANNTAEEEQQHYTPLEEHNNNNNNISRSGSSSSSLSSEALHKNNKRRNNKKRNKKGSLLHNEGGGDDFDNGGMISMSLRSTAPTVMSAEDALERDCSFFYRQEDDGLLREEEEGGSGFDMTSSGRQSHNHSRRHRFRTLQRPSDDPYRHDFLYQDAVDVVSPSVLNDYKAKYQQLNQDYYHQNNHYHNDAEDPFDDEEVEDGWNILSSASHSLQLQEGNGDTTTTTGTTSNTTSSNSIVRSDTAIYSSLCYMHHGRLLMRLPVDQVRLVMDPDLEAGILSVEQWRRESKPNEKRLQNHNNEKSVAARQQQPYDADENEQQERPPLRYVLTVPLDLYQKLVSEMSDGCTTRNRGSSTTKPLCAWVTKYCCTCKTRHEHGNEKADIRIAIIILLVVLAILFINTVIELGT